MMNINTKPFFKKAKKTVNKTKFDSFTYSKDGLLLKCRNTHEIEIPFADIDKIFIKTHKLNPFVELICIAFPFLFVFMAIQYFPFDLMILASIITILPIFMVVINYKWYRLYVCLNDGSTFRKKIALDLKTEYISMLKRVRTEYMHHNDSVLELA